MSDAQETIEVQGARVPALGFGTWQLSGRAAREGVEDALAIGYRQIDTARMYRNEREVGEAIAASGVARDELFVTTKVWPQDFRRDRLIAAGEDSLATLGLDVIDLLLLHWPSRDVPIEESLEALVELRERGVIRHLGVSNFPGAMLRRALEVAPVFCDQVEYHPLTEQDGVREVAEANDVLVTAYSPLAEGRVARDRTLKRIGERHGKSAAQVALRWLLEQPLVSPIPKAGSHQRRAENFDVFDFELSEEERAEIAAR